MSQVLLYRCPGPHFAHAGETYAYVAVEETAVAERLKDGWSLSLVEAVAKAQGEEPEDESAPSREELEAKATELGIKFDGRTGDAALLKKINAALGESE